MGTNTSIALVPGAKQAAVEILPDTDRYKCRFTIRSASGPKVYMIAFDAAAGALYWKCSCPGCIRHGDCKHLQAMGLPGRKKGASLPWAKKFGVI